MVLIIDGIVQDICPDNLRSFYNNHPNFKDTASQFRKVTKETVGPSGLLYVYQREFAVITPHDNIKIIGSDDATTCIIVVLKHSKFGVVALTHLDGSKTEEAVYTIFKKLSALLKDQLEDGIVLHLFGGYSDPQGYSSRLFKDIMNSIHMLPLRVQLGICCVGEMNTAHKGKISSPIIYGVGVDVESGRIFPACFSYKGPDEHLRGVRTICGSADILDVYNNSSRQMEIGPFELEAFPAANYYLQQDDEFILKYLSTSPDVEPSDFVPRIREQLRFILQNPYPALTVFPNNKPLCYKMDGSSRAWLKITL